MGMSSNQTRGVSARLSISVGGYSISQSHGLHLQYLLVLIL